MEYSALDIINNFNNLKGRRAVLNKQLEDAAMYAAPAKYGTMFDSKEGSSKYPQSCAAKCCARPSSSPMSAANRESASPSALPSRTWFAKPISVPGNTLSLIHANKTRNQT